MTTIVRAQILHTPCDPFAHGGDALETFSDGGLAYGADGRIIATGGFAEVHAAHPDAEVHDASDAVLLPGLVDLHVHYPQIAVIGAMGMTLLEWLATRTLPEEARLADRAYAESVARRFVGSLARNGTTTALVFGSHFPAAQEALFAEAERSGLLVASGLVVSDQNLMAVLHTTPEEAYAQSRGLIERGHGRGRLRYAVTPRFSLSCTDAMLETCGALLADGPAGSPVHEPRQREPGRDPGRRRAVPVVARLPAHLRAPRLVGRRSVLAHDVHVTDDELRRLARAGASVAHCPSRNAFLASGIFPMAPPLRARRALRPGHRRRRRHRAEPFQGGAHGLPRADGARGRPASSARRTSCTWPRGPAEALGLEDEIGDLSPGRSADYVLVRPPEDSTLNAVLHESPSAEATLGALFTLAREDCVAEVRVAGEAVSAGRPGAASAAHAA